MEMGTVLDRALLLWEEAAPLFFSRPCCHLRAEMYQIPCRAWKRGHLVVISESMIYTIHATALYLGRGLTSWPSFDPPSPRNARTVPSGVQSPQRLDGPAGAWPESTPAFDRYEISGVGCVL